LRFFPFRFIKDGVNLRNIDQLLESQTVDDNYRYHRLIDSSPLIISYCDLDLKITYMNRTCLTHYGVTLKEAQGKSLLDFVVPEYHEELKKLFKTVTVDNPQFEIDNPVPMDSGEIRWYHWIDQGIFDDQGNLVEYQSIGQDITRRYQAEEALKQSQEQLLEAQKIGRMGDWIWEVDTGALHWSDQNFRLLGYEPRSFQPTGDVFLNMLSRETRIQHEELIKKTFDEKNEFYEKIYPIDLPSGRRWFHDRCRVEYRGGKPVKVRGTVQDITPQKELLLDLERRIKTESLATVISTRFVKTPFSKINDAVEATLEELKLFFRARRCYLYFYDNSELEEPGSCLCTTGKASPFQGGPDPWHGEQEKMTPHFSSLILRGSGVCLNSEREIDEVSVREGEIFRRYGVQALLAVPLLHEDRSEGCLVLDADSPRPDWTEDVLGGLQLIAEIIVGALDRHKTQEQVHFLSFHDSLTGVYNRAYFKEELHRLDTVRQLPLSILMGDVNGLKLSNDVFGHQAGDRLLKIITGILRKNCREEDIIARWGGDEFIILLPKTSETTANLISSRILAACQEKDLEPIRPSIALGCATKVIEEVPIDLVIKEAEDRMYRRKLMDERSVRSAIIGSLKKTLFEKSIETETHVDRVVALAKLFGRHLKLSDSEQADLNLLSVMHDMGKIAVPRHILMKTEKLDPEEWEEITRHPETGYRIAKASPELSPIAELILGHHERWDGTGYPQGLKGKEVPRLCRIVSIIDSYDVMITGRIYAPPKTREEALAELEREAGRQFDPWLVKEFLSLPL
jgi:diguanylate cyclase (GGDEF)-like protein/PAS domain S-box-containing protein